MSVAPLPPREPSGSAAFARLRDGLQALSDIEDWRWGDADLLAAVEASYRHLSAAHAAALALVAELDRRGLAPEAGAPTTAAWLTAQVQVPVGQARGQVRLAHALDHHPATAAALASGHGERRARPGHHRHPRRPPGHGRRQQTLVEAEQTLLGHAQRFTPKVVGRIGTHLAAVLDPDGPRPDDRDPADPGYYLHLRTRADGAAEGEFRLDPVTALTLHQLLDAGAAPRPSTVEGPDPRPAGQRRADAFADIIRAAAGCEQPLPGHGRPHLAVTVTLDQLRDGLPVLGPDHQTLTAEVIRRLACDAGIIPIVLGSRSEVLDVGRKRRTVPTGIRRALIVRDKGCAFPRCDRPPGWTDAHHIIPWSHGGPTSLDNLVLLCGHHHDTVHHRGWTVAMSEHGHPQFTPPAWLRTAA